MGSAVGGRAPTLLVLGAGGSLGRAVCAAAERLLPGVALRRGGRRAAPPGGVRADLRDPASLARALVGADVAIDAVGPFDYEAEPLVRACAAAGCDWIDLADQPGFLAAADAAAHGAAIAVASGCSVAPALVEALAAPLASRAGVASIRAWWSIGSRKAVSGALLYALLRPLGRRGAGGLRAPGPIVERRIGGMRFWFGLYPWPRGAHARLADRLPIELRVGMDNRGQARALRALAPFVGRVPEPWLLRASRAFQPATRLVTRLGAATGALAVEALDGSGTTLAAAEVVAPQGLDLAALPPVWAARALLAARAPAGPVALSTLLPPSELAAAMRVEGWIVTGF